jgi:hypothetical protein
MNFQIQLTILNDRVTGRSWLNGLVDAQKLTSECPMAFRSRVETGEFLPFVSRGNPQLGWYGTEIHASDRKFSTFQSVLKPSRVLANTPSNWAKCFGSETEVR